MATQLRTARQLVIAGETLDWTETEPYIWELAFPGGPRIGQIVEIPAHGRTKQTWQRQDTGDRYTSVMVACSDLLTDYYRKQARQLPDDDIPTMPEPAPVLTLVPKPERPTGVPAGWITQTEAAAAYTITPVEMAQWIAAGLIEHVTAGKTVYVPAPTLSAPPQEPAQEIVTEETGRWVPVAEAAALFGITVTTIRTRMTTGQLPGRKVQPPGKRWQWEVLIPAPEPEALRPDDPRCADPEGLARIQTQLAQFEDLVAEEVRATQEAAWHANHPTEPQPAPLPTAAPLADFASPTIEVQHAPAPDDHLLDDPDLAPPHEMRLLAAMQRIGYLEAQLEHWQERAMEMGRKLQTLQGEYDQLQASKRFRWFGR